MCASSTYIVAASNACTKKSSKGSRDRSASVRSVRSARRRDQQPRRSRRTFEFPHDLHAQRTPPKTTEARRRRRAHDRASRCTRARRARPYRRRSPSPSAAQCGTSRYNVIPFFPPGDRTRRRRWRRETARAPPFGRRGWGHVTQCTLLTLIKNGTCNGTIVMSARRPAMITFFQTDV